MYAGQNTDDLSSIPPILDVAKLVFEVFRSGQKDSLGLTELFQSGVALADIPQSLSQLAADADQLSGGNSLLWPLSVASLINRLLFEYFFHILSGVAVPGVAVPGDIPVCAGDASRTHDQRSREDVTSQA